MVASFTDYEYFNAKLTLLCDPCFGSCPVYTLSIDSKGWVVYKGKNCVEVTGRHEEFIGPEKVRALLETFVTNDFASHARYNDDLKEYTDLPSVRLSL